MQHDLASDKSAQAHSANSPSTTKPDRSQSQGAPTQGAVDQKSGQSHTNQAKNGQPTTPAEQRAARDGAQQQAQANSQTASQQGQDAQGKPQEGSPLQTAGQGGAQSAGDQQALKAEIQQLLKDVSGELQQLQSQLAASQDHAPTTPGTGTDPQLYESPMAIDPSAGRPVPVQLKTDTNSAVSKRQGSGVGTPSGEVSSEAPTVSPQDAQLSDKPLQESATARQTVPFEYRDVFGRLHRRSLQTSEMPQ